MTKLHFGVAALLACAALAPGLSTAQDLAAAEASYAQMCMQAVDMPKPYGESDLKGNPKLGEYCKCFSGLFTKRAMKAAEAMQAGKAPPPLEESNRQELALRNTCRKQTGLPLAVAPNAKK